MSDAVDDFVRNGVGRYAEAQQTVTFFRERVFVMLEQALKAALEDGALALAEKADIRRCSGEFNTECWLNLLANVTLRTGGTSRPTRIEVGVWWNPSADPCKAACVVYANLRDDDGGTAKLTFAPGTITPMCARCRTRSGRACASRSEIRPILDGTGARSSLGFRPRQATVGTKNSASRRVRVARSRRASRSP